MSAFTCSCGTQKLWMTSALVTANRTVRPAGTWISLAVTAPPGYWASHHHMCPVTLMSRVAARSPPQLPSYMPEKRNDTNPNGSAPKKAGVRLLKKRPPREAPGSGSPGAEHARSAVGRAGGVFCKKVPRLYFSPFGGGFPEEA